MEKFKFVVPTIEWKKKAIDFINEFYKYNSNINGTGGLQRYLDNYEGWLEKLEEDYNRQPSEEEVFMDADKDNPASWKTIESLGGKNIREYFEDEFDHCIVKDYIINVKTAIDSNKDKYEQYIINIF